MGADNCAKLQEARQAFVFEGDNISCERYGSGHINDTFRVINEAKGREHHYILQRMNHEIFKDPVALVKNIAGVTGFLRKKIIENGGDPYRETLNLVDTKDGGNYYVDSDGNYWRAYLFIGDATCYNLVEKPEDFYQSGKAFGHFQRLLSDYPAKELSETILNFHNTPVRFATFKQAVKEDICHRAASVMPEIQFVMDRAADMSAAQNMLEEGKLPLRVTHNDTKLNNIMIDNQTGEAICIIDLDTIMPGLSIFDFGDSIRFGANTAEEDEQDLSKVSLSLSLFEIYTKGFAEGCQGSLTDAEVQMLSMGSKLMTLECGMRFLTDHLQGDTYFKIHRENHNLDRARTQFGLVADMEKKWSKMEAIVNKYC
ncbi:MAG: aminoglycoside phosphotransferase family protein [Hungatella sp.]